jgi:penicillin-insensitive murein endopeptidase
MAQKSTCYGTTKKGHLVDGVELPERGKNFITYSTIARLAGRTYVHSSVRDIILKSYKKLEMSQKMKVYKYAETGYKKGGRFRPHKTHQNGLSVDFITPVIDKKGHSVHLPTHIGNQWGYKIEFNNQSRYKEFTIDYIAMAAHITALHQAAKTFNLDLWRVIFDPKLQAHLFQTKYADYLKKHVVFSNKPSWVRHDEHYHVDFKIPCKK